MRPTILRGRRRNVLTEVRRSMLAGVGRDVLQRSQVEIQVDPSVNRSRIGESYRFSLPESPSGSGCGVLESHELMMWRDPAGRGGGRCCASEDPPEVATPKDHPEVFSPGRGAGKQPSTPVLGKPARRKRSPGGTKETSQGRRPAAPLLDRPAARSERCVAARLTRCAAAQPSLRDFVNRDER